MSRCLPIIHAIHPTDETTCKYQQLDIEFSNGQRRSYTRQVFQGQGSVIVVPYIDTQTILLVREYAAGIHRYELGLVKGRIDPGETPLDAANRELKEEAGYGAKDLRILRTLSLLPSYMTTTSYLVLAQQLYPERLPGDEPEPLEVISWPVSRIPELLFDAEFSEGRSLAALLIAAHWMEKHG